MAKVLVTGASGVAGRRIAQRLHRAGHRLRLTDVGAAHADLGALGEYQRCDTRTPMDLERAVDGMDAVVHLAAWHCAHDPAVSDETIFAVNVDGGFNLAQAARRAGVGAIVFASSMAYGWANLYALTKVLGEDIFRAWHEWTGRPVALLRYHAFVPGPYLEYGERLLRNGVDVNDVARATEAALVAMLEGRIGLFRSIVHTDHGLPETVRADFARKGAPWCEQQMAGAMELIEKYGLKLPGEVEQHDLSEAAGAIGWRPEVNFIRFLEDLRRRDAEGLPIRELWVEGALPEA